MECHPIKEIFGRGRDYLWV